MAYDPSNLSVLGHNNGFTLWHYKSRDDGLVAMTHPEIEYFNPAAAQLRTGDLLILNASVDLQDDGRTWSAPEHAMAFVTFADKIASKVRIELAGPVCRSPRV